MERVTEKGEENVKGIFSRSEETSIISFLNGKHPSKAYMPALDISTNTFHSWKAKGFIDYPDVGTGNPLFLSGAYLLYVQCVVHLRDAGFSLRKVCKSSLEDRVKDFIKYFTSTYESNEYIEEKYAVFKYNDLYTHVEAEWHLCAKNEILKEVGEPVDGVSLGFPIFIALPLKRFAFNLSKNVRLWY